MRRILAALGAALVLSLVAVPAAPSFGQQAPDPSSPVTPDSEQAIEDLVSCVQGSHHLLVMFLMDESYSLRRYDPQNRRVDAAKTALDSLAGLASAGRDAPTIDIALATFANNYRLARNWTSLTEPNRATLDGAIEGFRTRNSGIDTDFVNALTGARRALTRRAAQVTEDGSRPPCRAVLLFTDGQFDLALRRTAESQAKLGKFKPYAPKIPLTTKANVQKVEEAGRSALCRKGGLADDLRADRVTLLSVALSGSLSARAQRPLAAASAGKADDYPCGTPTDRTPGVYLPAKDDKALLLAFDDIVTRIGNGTPYPEDPNCKGTSCGGGNGTRVFDIDRNARNLHIFALSPEPGAHVVLTAPKAEGKVEKEGSVALGPMTATSQELGGNGFSIDINRPGDLESWTGQWKIALVDKADKPIAGGAIQVYVFSELGVRIDRPTALQRGIGTPVQVSIVAPADAKLDETVAKATATMRVNNPVTGATTSVDLVGPPQGPFIATLEVPDDLLANAVDITATLKVTSKTGAELTSQATRESVFVRRPKGDIQFAPPQLSLPSVTSTGSTSDELLLIGGDEAGCVWFGKPDVSGPDGANPITFTVDGKDLPKEGDCIPVPAGQQKSVAIEAKPAGKALGTVHGFITVNERVGKRPAQATQIAVRFDIAGGVDASKRLLVAALLIVAGIAIPMLLLLIINGVSARFQDLDAIVGTALPITVQGRQISRREPNGRRRPFQIGASDFTEIAESGSTRQFVFGGIHFRSRASRNPFGGTQALAAPEGGAEKLKGGEGSRVELDPGLTGSWIFLLDADQTAAARDGRIEGTVIAFAAADAADAQAARMVPDIENRLPGTAQSLAELLRSSLPKHPRKPRAEHASHAPAAPPAQDAPADDVAVEEPAGGARADSPFDLPAGADAPAASGVPSPSAAGDPSADEGPAEPEAPAGTPAAPVGFGGAGASAPVRPPTPAPADEGDGDGDDEPPAPPVGFGGIAPT